MGNFCSYEVRATKNTGKGGKHLKGDGVNWCDMTGSGNDDLVFIDHNSKISIFRNLNTPPDTSRYPGWATVTTLDLAGTDREAIYLADWNGDGRCDILTVVRPTVQHSPGDIDPLTDLGTNPNQNKATGAVHARYTTYTESSASFTFGARTEVVSAGCDQGWGVALLDRGARFHDIDGDGRADYLCMAPDGTTTAWLNKATGLEWKSQIKFADGRDRKQRAPAIPSFFQNPWLTGDTPQQVQTCAGPMSMATGKPTCCGWTRCRATPRCRTTWARWRRGRARSGGIPRGRRTPARRPAP